MKCWLCDEEVTAENCSDIKKNKKECKGCHNIYGIFMSIKKLTEEELRAKVEKVFRIAELHEIAVSHPEEDPRGLTKIYHSRKEQK